MNKTVLITGASKGIGLCCALGLKTRGYRVFATARQEADLKKLQGQGFEALPLNLNDSASINQLIEILLQQTQGKLDALINNAGYGQPGAIEDLSRDLIRAQFEANVFGPIELTNHIIPVMRRQGYGRIINISSLLGIITLAYRGAYNASKFALEGFTDTLRQELTDTSIKVVLIEPGPIASQFRESAYIQYLRTIKPEASFHRDKYEKISQKLALQKTTDPFTLQPEAVFKTLIHALESTRPKIRYYVTLPAHVLPLLKRLLPDRLMDWILRRISAGEMR